MSQKKVKGRPVGAIITLSGVVQGVGFRPFVHRLARDCGLAGTVRNFSGGVSIEVEGSQDRVAEFYQRVSQEAPSLAQVLDKQMQTRPLRGMRTFSVRESARDQEQQVLVPADIATCQKCLREMADPEDRRYRYPFINCTDCGPRFTIIEDMPYDRPMTTMRAFTMCHRCREEYRDIDHRRYHAQPNACPECGPQLSFVDREGARMRGQKALEAAIGRLRGGDIVAVRGIGGFHLCCDATDDGAIAKLRRRKNRPVKPLALMMPDLEQVRRCCHLSTAEEQLLCSPMRPIVVLTARRGTLLSPLVAPGNDTLGVMLPYAPVHVLLLEELPAVVATSANCSDQPLIGDNEQALRDLDGIADAFLFHDREIHTRCDDSIYRVIGDRPVPLRRARGFAPMPIELPGQVPPVLACGAELKNTFCLALGDRAFVSQHIGDLKNLETYSYYKETIERFEHLFRIRPRILAHDLHPQYLSTRYAQRRSAREGGQMPTVAVQHHHAHVAACMADNGRIEPVIGVVFDGLGYGTDGHIWGAEFMIADYAAFRRLGQLRYVPLPGGDAANREPWRMAASYLHLLRGPGLDAPARDLFGQQDDAAVEAVLELLSRGYNAPLASSMGRLFDAVSSLLDLCQRNTFEGQAAVSLEAAARDATDPSSGYAWTIDERDGTLIADPGPVIEGLLADRRSGKPIGQIARRFHLSVAQMAGACCARIREAHGINAVALTGGVFQNQLLAGMTMEELRRRGFELLLHRQVPPNDGGIALGQAVVAACMEEGRATCV